MLMLAKAYPCWYTSQNFGRSEMKKAIIITCIVLSGLIILDSMNAGHALMMFLLAGMVPGTTIILSPNDMMSLFALLIGFVLARVTNSIIMQIRATERQTTLQNA